MTNHLGLTNLVLSSYSWIKQNPYRSVPAEAMVGAGGGDGAVEAGWPWRRPGVAAGAAGRVTNGAQLIDVFLAIYLPLIY
jgi:hypothetical protein